MPNLKIQDRVQNYSIRSDFEIRFEKNAQIWLWTWPQMTADEPGSIQFNSIAPTEVY